MKVCTPRASGFCRRASLGVTRDLLLALQRFAASCHSCKTQILKCPIFLPSSRTATYPWDKQRMTIALSGWFLHIPSWQCQFHIGRGYCWTSNVWLVLGYLSWALGWGWVCCICNPADFHAWVQLQRDIPFHSAWNSERKVTDNPS